MSIKRLKYNKESRIIEVIEEKSQIVDANVVQSKKRRDTVNFVLSILSFIISVGALGISYYQKVANETQVDVSVRQFELSKKPIFECFTEQEELYNDDYYWDHYKMWLFENKIKSFEEWYQQKFPENTIQYIREKRKFWDAYDNYDTKSLAELTEGEFEVYESEYKKYLSTQNYVSYDRWKESPYVFKKVYITLLNFPSRYFQTKPV